MLRLENDAVDLQVPYSVGISHTSPTLLWFSCLGAHDAMDKRMFSSSAVTCYFLHYKHTYCSPIEQHCQFGCQWFITIWWLPSCNGCHWQPSNKRIIPSRCTGSKSQAIAVIPLTRSSIPLKSRNWCLDSIAEPNQPRLNQHFKKFEQLHCSTTVLVWKISLQTRKTIMSE